MFAYCSKRKIFAKICLPNEQQNNQFLLFIPCCWTLPLIDSQDVTISQIKRNAARNKLWAFLTIFGIELMQYMDISLRVVSYYFLCQRWHQANTPVTILIEYLIGIQGRWSITIKNLIVPHVIWLIYTHAHINVGFHHLHGRWIFFVLWIHSISIYSSELLA